MRRHWIGSMTMSKNTYLEKRQAVNQAFLDAGEQMGLQKMWDYVQIALRDPEIVGKDVFGRARLEKLYRQLMKLADYYHIAFTDDVEADYRQEEIDARLREIWGDDMSTFYDRYPQLKKQEYGKKRKGWT